MVSKASLSVSLAVLFALATPAAAQRDFDKVEIKAQKLAEGVYMLSGAGGNMGLSVGSDGTFLIDDQYAPLTPRIKAAIAAISDKPLRFLLNTHWHGDHTGGNKNLGEGGVLIVAHDNVRKRMSTEQFLSLFNEKVPASPAVALPVVTFGDAVTFHLNGDEIHVFHVAPAHTDGDAIIHFRKANIVHAGDTFFNGMYPFIDVSSGGSIDGMIAAADRLLAMVDAKTQIIPGHGPVGDRTQLKSFRDMLAGVRDAIRPLASAGKTVKQIVETKPTTAYDEIWGKGFLKPDTFAEIVATDLTGKAKNPPN
jgi:glyoxylase-like metal-dependent hydrolase (beta-lactamase superfamily II)